MRMCVFECGFADCGGVHKRTRTHRDFPQKLPFSVHFDQRSKLNSILIFTNVQNHHRPWRKMVHPHSEI